MRREPERRANRDVEGYVSGPDAPVVALAAALRRVDTARSVVLVEGVSDQIALETLAERSSRDLTEERVVVVPMGGAQALSRHLERFGPRGAGLSIVGMCDAGAEGLFRDSLTAAGLGSPRNRHELEQLGFFVCVDDLETELIRASSRTTILDLLEAQRDLSSFRSLQNQPAWRDQPFERQFHRWLRAGSRRTLRYARLLTLIIETDRMPRPLEGVLAASRLHRGT